MKQFLYLLLLLLLVILVSWNLIVNWTTLIAFPWRFSVINIAVLLILFFAVHIVNGFSWHLIIKALGGEIPLYKSLKIWSLSNYARLLPGSIWQYAGRVYLADKNNISKTVTSLSLVLEIVFSVWVGVILILAVFYLFPLPVFSKLGIDYNNLFPVLILLIFSTLLLTNTSFTTSVVSLINRILKKEGVVQKVSLPLKWLPALLGCYFLQYLLSSMILFFLARNALDLPFNQFPYFIGIFSIAWLLGYVVIFAPSGLGVQEATLTGLLLSYLPLAVAGLIAVTLRLFWLGSESLYLIFILWLNRQLSRKQPTFKKI